MQDAVSEMRLLHRKKKIKDLQRSPCKYSAKYYYSVYECEETTQSQGEKTSVRIRRNRAWRSHWAGNSALSHQLDWKISIHVTLGEILRKILLTGGT